MMKIAMRLYLVIIIGLLSTQFSYAKIDLYQFDTPEQERQFQTLGQKLRCPKCQNNSIADSNAELAQDLRHKVYEMTMAGKSEEEIVSYMVDRYGHFVTYEPPLTAGTIILWLAPLMVLLLGFGFIFHRSQKIKVRSDEVTVWSGEQESRLNELLNENQDHMDEKQYDNEKAEK